MHQDNVIHLPGRRPDADTSSGSQGGEPVPSTEPEHRGAGAAAVLGGFALSTLGHFATAVRYAAFFVLRWVRGPVSLLLGLTSGLSLLASVIVWFGYSNSPSERWSILPYLMCAGLAASALRFSYNWLLFRLSPQPGLI